MLLGHVSLASAVHSDAAGPIRLSPGAEKRRLDRHFRRVLRRLRRHAPAGLTGEARRNRARHIEELERYRKRGRFPRNVRHPGRRLPIFVDDAGTRCAMGHLIEQAGGGDLVRGVARRHNLARVHELAVIPSFMAWLMANGLTVDEAALIQPSYCETAASCVCSGIGDGMLEGEASAGETGMVLTIAAVHGDVGDLVVGDAVALGEYTLAEAGDRVMVMLNQNGVVTGEWIVEGGQVTVDQCSYVAPSPGPLDADVFVEASLSDGETCRSILEEQDPAWTTPQGDCGNLPGDPGDPDDPGLPFFPDPPGGPREPTEGGATEGQTVGGCSVTPGLTGDMTSAAVLLLGAGWLLMRRR